MGLFKFLKPGIILSRVAEAHDAAFRCFDNFEMTSDLTALEVAAWYLKAGVQDLSIKYDLNPVQAIFIQIHGKVVKTSLAAAISRCDVKIIQLLAELGEEERAYIMDILDGGDAFNEVENEIPNDIRKKYERNRH